MPLEHSDKSGVFWTRILDPKIRHWKGEVVNRAKDGSLVPVLLTIIPVNAPDGTMRGYMGIAVDLTAKKEMEAKVAHQDRLASVGTLARPAGLFGSRGDFSVSTALVRARSALLGAPGRVFVGTLFVTPRYKGKPK